MSDDSKTSIEDKLRQAWREERRYTHTRGAVRVVLWLVGLLLAAFVIDWLILRGRAGTGFTVLLAVACIAILAWVAWREWFSRLKPFDPLNTALDVEKRHPDLKSLLVTYTQLERPAEDQGNVSPELVSAMRDQAIDRARPVDFKEIVDFRTLRNLFLVAGCMVLFFLAVSINWKEHFGAMFARMTGRDVEYPTKTIIGDTSGDLLVRFGDTAWIEGKAGGVIPESGTLFTRPADDEEAPWKELPLALGADGTTFSRELEQLSSDLSYYLEIGDDRTEPHQIRVIRSPRVVSTQVQLDYPEYMGRETGASDQLNLEVPAGTTLTYRLECEPAVKQLEIQRGHEDDEERPEPLLAKISEDGKQATFTMKADEAIDYRFQWTEGFSGEDFRYDDVQHGVRVVADALPEIRLDSPDSDGLATPAKTITLLGRAADDYGLGQAWLVYLVDGSAEVRKPLTDFKGSPSGEIEYRWKIADDVPDLKPDTQISVALEVSDLYPSETGAHLRRTPARHFTIVDTERYLSWYRSELAAQQEELMRARDSESSAADEVKQLREQEDENDEN